MKKSKIITLMLITAALASCNNAKKQKKYYLRSDSTARYSRNNSHIGWFHAFRPYGNYSNGNYTHTGFYSSAINSKSNIGTSTSKSSVLRGGFGRSSFSVSS